MARGTVFKKDNNWAFRVDGGIDHLTGKRQQVLRHGFNTKREAEKSLDELVHAKSTGTGAVRSKARVAEFLDNWLETQHGRLRETTHGSYTVAVERIKMSLGTIPLQSLAPLQIESFYAELASTKARRPLSAKTIRNTHVVLRKALGDAERLGLVVRNSAAAARPPIARRPEFETWSSEQLRTFFEAAKGSRFYAVFIVCATTGMRRGEVVGLRWADIDFDAKQLAVVQTITTVNNRLIVSPPKTLRSRRTLFLDVQTLEVLGERRRLQREQRMAAGAAWTKSSDLVFTDSTGDSLHPDGVTREFTRLSRDAGLPVIRLHDLRHTYATLALKTGIHPKVVSERLGHASVGITLDLYSHVTPAIARDAADSVAATIFGT